jgi:starvation-inducible outer membrane lipoprotein
MSRFALLAVVLAMLSGCITLPSNVARELEPVRHDHPDHFQKP